MARKLSTRKRAGRDEYAIREQRKLGGITEAGARQYLGKFFNKGIVSSLHFRIARGKESDVYIAGAGPALAHASYVILKAFRTDDTSFRRMRGYMAGAARIGRKGGGMLSATTSWCRKEFNNLEAARSAGVAAPSPYMSNGTILAMEFIGSESGVRAPRLKETTLEYPDRTLREILAAIAKLYRHGLVHADMSEYNVLVADGNRPVLIDFGQAVQLRHPNAEEFLERDVRNILHYFEHRYGVRTEPNAALASIRG